MTDQLPEDQILTKDKIHNVINNKCEHTRHKQKCEYCNCNKDAEMNVLIPLTNVKGDSVSLQFCKYHAHILLGGQFTARKDGTMYHMSGPTKEVQLIEQVMAAREMMRKKE